MSARVTVLGWLAKRVGFPLLRGRTLPGAERMVGEISDVEQRIYDLTYLIDEKMTAVANLKS
jgi:hypothetical protein